MAPQTALRICYSIQEFAEMTGLGRTRTFEEIKIGRLRAFKSGRRTLISYQELNRWMAELESQCPARGAA